MVAIEHIFCVGKKWRTMLTRFSQGYEWLDLNHPNYRYPPILFHSILHSTGGYIGAFQVNVKNVSIGCPL
jgi:hypothetical protein